MSEVVGLILRLRLLVAALGALVVLLHVEVRAGRPEENVQGNVGGANLNRSGLDVPRTRILLVLHSVARLNGS